MCVCNSQPYGVCTGIRPAFDALAAGTHMNRYPLKIEARAIKADLTHTPAPLKRSLAFKHRDTVGL